MGHRYIHASTLIAILLGVSICLGCNSIAGGDSFSPVRGPVVAVLGQSPFRVLLLDATTLADVGTVPLATQSIGMDSIGDRVLTAQCGQPGDKSDTRLGVIAPGAGRISYFDTGCLDPEAVFSTRSGWSVVVNGVIDEHGQRVERVIGAGTKVEPLTVPPAVQGGAATRDAVWLLCRPIDTGAAPAADRLLRVSGEGPAGQESLEVSATTALCGLSNALVSIHPVAGGTRIVLRDATTGAVMRERLVEGLTGGIGLLWGAGDRIIVADASQGDPSTVSRAVVFDEELRTLGEIEGLRGLTAAGIASDGSLVICEADGVVSIRDPKDFEVVTSRQVGTRTGELLDIAFVAPASR